MTHRLTPAVGGALAIPVTTAGVARADGPIAVQLLGYDQNGHEQWNGVGAYSPGTGGRASVPWGNALATPALRAAGTYGSPGAEVTRAELHMMAGSGDEGRSPTTGSWTRRRRAWDDSELPS